MIFSAAPINEAADFFYANDLAKADLTIHRG
jgi:hypothetical protein